MTLLPADADVLTLEYKIFCARRRVDGRVDGYVEADGGRLLCAALQQSIMRAPS